MASLICTQVKGIIAQKEIAHRLGISLSGARSGVQRAHQKLREVIVECCLLELDSQGQLISMEIKDSCGSMQPVKKEVQKNLNISS